MANCKPVWQVWRPLWFGDMQMHFPMWSPPYFLPPWLHGLCADLLSVGYLSHLHWGGGEVGKGWAEVHTRKVHDSAYQWPGSEVLRISGTGRQLTDRPEPGGWGSCQLPGSFQLLVEVGWGGRLRLGEPLLILLALELLPPPLQAVPWDSWVPMAVPQWFCFPQPYSHSSSWMPAVLLVLPLVCVHWEAGCPLSGDLFGPRKFKASKTASLEVSWAAYYESHSQDGAVFESLLNVVNIPRLTCASSPASLSMIEVLLYKRDFSKPNQEQQNNIKHFNSSLEETKPFPLLTPAVQNGIIQDGIFAWKGKPSLRLKWREEREF